ncbi:MAG TPA: glycosyltransferase family 9 protein [Candidatus Acidoferrales bacterium]|nr:glycosyltransferase family 9 protein [Candidatus Acidoferrales bacterium]
MLKLATGATYAVGEASAPFSRFLTYSVPKSWCVPFLETQDKIVTFLGIATPLDPPTIQLRPEERVWARSELISSGLTNTQPILGVQCSSVVPSKCWPAKNFGEVVSMLWRQFPELAVISFGISRERGSAEVAHNSAGSVYWLEGTGKWKIRETLAMLSECDLFISGDTGLMHMAAAIGTRTVSIFGPTSTTRRAPLHNGGVALCPDSPCHPCFRGRWTPCDCICSIMPERVFAAAEQYLKPYVSIG